MFDIFAKLLSSVASFLFPVFASYKALKTSDPTQLAPWLMYWVVLACALLIESWSDWFLVWIPFYAYIRLLFFLYLVLPQTQGARVIYETYVYPRLEENETAIEELIASAGARLRSAGFAELKRLIQWVTNALGLPSSPQSQAAAAAPPEPQSPQSYTQSLLARFTVPAARWSAPPTTTTPGGAGHPTPAGTGLTGDFYNFLASAVAAATTSSSKQPQPPSGLGSLLPDSLLSAPASARSTFINAQRERLRAVLSALDREEAALGQGHTEGQGSSSSGDGKRRSLSEQSAASGLSKSRSEGDFEKVEMGSGAEDCEEGEGGEGGVRRRGVGGAGAGGQEAAGAGSGGGWMPWGWGAGGGETGRSSGLEK